MTHEEDPLAPASGILLGVVLSVLLFWLPLFLAVAR